MFCSRLHNVITEVERLLFKHTVVDNKIPTQREEVTCVVTCKLQIMYQILEAVTSWKICHFSSELNCFVPCDYSLPVKTLKATAAVDYRIMHEHECNRCAGDFCMVTNTNAAVLKIAHMHNMIVTRAMLSQVVYRRLSCVQSAVCRSERNKLWLNVLQTGFKDHLEERQSFVLACFFLSSGCILCCLYTVGGCIAAFTWT